MGRWGAFEPQTSNQCHLFTWPETCGRERHVAGIRKAFGDVGWRVEFCIIDLLRWFGEGGMGELWPIDPAGAASCTRSPSNPHTEAGRAARISGSVEGRVNRLTIFVDCSAVLRRPMNFQMWSNQIHGARSCWKSLYSANLDIPILSLIYQSWHSPRRESVWGRRDMASLILTSALGEGERSISYFGRRTPGVSVGILEKGEISYHCFSQSIPGSSSP